MNGLNLTSRRFARLAALAVAVATGSSAWAASGNWTSTGGGNWSDPTKWSSNPTVPGTAAGDAVNLAADFTTGAKTINLDVNAIVGTMTFGDSNATSPSALTLSSTNSSTLTFNNSGAGATLTLQGSTSNAITVGILLADNLAISGTSTLGTPPISSSISASTAGLKTITTSNSDLRLTGNITDGSGSVAINKTSGSLTLAGNSSFTGGVNSATGTLVIQHNNALGTGTLTIGGTFNASSTLTIGNNVVIAANVAAGTGILTINGSVTNSGANRTWTRAGITNFAGPIYLSETSATGRNFTNESSGTLSGVISNFNGVGGANGGVTYGATAARLWQVTQTDNTYTGTTTISNANGVLEVAKLANGGQTSSIGASSSTASNLIINGGILRYVGSTNSVTDRLVQFSSTSTIESSGLGTLDLSNTGTPTVNSSNRGVILGGTNTGDNYLRWKLTGTLTTGVNRLTKEGAGKWILTNANTYQAGTTINNGTLLVNNTTGSGTGTGAVVVNGGTLGGVGIVTGAVSGAGHVGPGSSPGILTVGQIDPTGGLDFDFEFTQTGAPTYANRSVSGNDVLEISHASSPFTASLTSANIVNIYLNVAGLNNGDIFRGGFYTDVTGAPDFLSTIQNATLNYYVKTTGVGDVTYNGVNYLTLANYNPTASFFMTTVADSGLNANGRVTQFSAAIPEPASLALLGLGGLLMLPRRTKKA